MSRYDVIVVGAGHAGTEAALASSRMGCQTLLITLSRDTIGHMSCNPAIGGVGKGQLVKEIDALGGEMARAADACGIQFRILNASKGPAVQSSRAQIDRKLYKKYMQGVIKGQDRLDLKESEVKGLLVEDRKVVGVQTIDADKILAEAIVLAPGTFLEGIIHVGLNHVNGGRINEPASRALAQELRGLGLKLLSFKTGTCARLDKHSIDYSKLIIQEGDANPRPFSFSTNSLKNRQLPCHITYTNEDTHRIILANLDRSPLYSGIIQSTGVRYCPSIEDKVVKFRERNRHQIFLEPEGLDVANVYPNGLATSLPEDVQVKFIRSIEGLEEAKILVFGYGIEHAVVEPTQLYPSLQTKSLKNLFLAGQINGTTGYEEAAAQGLAAGINASLSVQGRDPLILDRSSSYIGVLIDDLTTKGTNEPYRMFTSRVEYRLILREDNADLRLNKIGHEIGLVKSRDYHKTEAKAKEIEGAIKLFKERRLKPSEEVNAKLSGAGLERLSKAVTLEGLLKRPNVAIADIKNISAEKIAFSDSALFEAQIEVKYSGFIQRQRAEVERFRHLEKIRLPEDMEYKDIPGLSREIREKLGKFRPISLGQASRISGVTPAAISILMVYLKKLNG